MSKNTQDMFSCICMLKQTSIHFFIDLTQNHKKKNNKKDQFEISTEKFLKNNNSKINVLEHSALPQMKENYPNYFIAFI